MMDEHTRDKIESGEIKVCAGCGIHSTHAEWGTYKCKDCEEAEGETLV